MIASIPDHSTWSGNETNTFNAGINSLPQFPPFATNEIGRFLVAGRREIGHGMYLVNVL